MSKWLKDFSVILLFVFIGNFFLDTVTGHGMLLEPTGRSSRWRYDRTAYINYDDNALYCGGFYQQWEVNGGKCGICGDDYSLATPRPNEMGGRFGTGFIVRTYHQGSVIPVGVQITASHLGYFIFELCNLDEAGSESESCFKRINLGNGSDRFPITSSASAYYETTLQLPANVTCVQCVLRWTYWAGNNWGVCANGTGALGCGPQENFKNCADISITSTRSIVMADEVERNIPCHTYFSDLFKGTKIDTEVCGQPKCICPQYNNDGERREIVPKYNKIEPCRKQHKSRSIYSEF